MSMCVASGRCLHIGGGVFRVVRLEPYLNSDSEICSLSNLILFDQVNFILVPIVKLFCVIICTLGYKENKKCDGNESHFYIALSDIFYIGYTKWYVN